MYVNRSLALAANGGPDMLFCFVTILFCREDVRSRNSTLTPMSTVS